MFVRSPTFTNSVSSVTVSGSSPDSRSAGRASAGVRGALPSAAAGDRRDVRGRGAAAPADEVDEAAGGELLEDRGGLLRRLVVLTEGVGQPGVRIAGDEGVGDARELGDVGPHLLRAQRAVEADEQRVHVPDGVPERLGDLTGERAAGGVGDGSGDHHRPAASALLEQRLQREDRRLRVQRVEDRLDAQHVGAAVDQAVGGGQVGLDQLVEGHVAGAGVVHVGRDGRRPAGRADRADDVARPVGRPLGHRVALGARQPCRGLVELVRELLHAVVGQGDRGGVERVGLDEVRAGLEVLAVDRGDDAGRGDAEQVVVALHVARPVGEALAAVARLVGAVPLDGGAHGAVEHQDALLEQRGQRSRRIRAEVRGAGRHRTRVDARGRRRWFRARGRARPTPKSG